MAENSKIQWTHHTFNPWRGCTKVSAGCRNCYADVQAKRNPQVLGLWGPNGSRVVASDAQWREPLKWNKAAEASGERHRVFCASMADVFEARDTMPHGFAHKIEAARLRLFRLIQATPHLDWLLLTKRPQNITRAITDAMGLIDIYAQDATADMLLAWTEGKPPTNVWLGVSVENQAAADERIPHLLATPAMVRFLSCEPLLGSVDLRRYLPNPFTGFPKGPRIGWAIVGGESGHGARSFDLAWARELVEQCKNAGVPCFVKQLGERPVTTTGNEWGRTPLPMLAQGGYWLLKDRKGGDPAEWPEHLRVREFPTVA